MEAVKLDEYIDTHHCGYKAHFARAQGVHRQQVNTWVNKGFVVIDDVLYSPLRELEPVKMSSGSVAEKK